MIHNQRAASTRLTAWGEAGKRGNQEEWEQGCEAGRMGSQQAQRPPLYKVAVSAGTSPSSPTHIHQHSHRRLSAPRGTPLSAPMGISHPRQAQGKAETRGKLERVPSTATAQKALAPGSTPAERQPGARAIGGGVAGKEPAWGGGARRRRVGLGRRRSSPSA